jgi:hypothetical protein
MVPVSFEIDDIVDQVNRRCCEAKRYERHQRRAEQRDLAEFLTGERRQKNQQVLWPLMDAYGLRQ